jgi:hypothetical protein
MPAISGRNGRACAGARSVDDAIMRAFRGSFPDVSRHIEISELNMSDISH